MREPAGPAVVWNERRQGGEVGVSATGTALTPPLAALCAKRGFRLFLLGAEPGVADELAERLRVEHPGLAVAAHAGSSDPSADGGTFALVRAHGGQVLPVGFGAPNQGMWMDRPQDPGGS